MLADKISERLNQIREDINYVLEHFDLNCAENLENSGQSNKNEPLFFENESLNSKKLEITSENPADSSDENEISSMLLFRSLQKMRNLRAKLLDDSFLFGPAWDMFLELAVASGGGEQVSVSSLCIASNAPATTALRYMELMVNRGIFLKVVDPKDRRRVHVQLSQAGKDIMKTFNEQVQNELKQLVRNATGAMASQ